MHILHEADIDISGFAGVRERHYVMDQRRFGDYRSDGASDGLGALVYLADAHMRPGGSTGRHSHQRINIVTWVIGGQLLHQGTLADNTRLGPGEVQVQIAGERGFEHNEINAGEQFNRFIQLWLLPDEELETGYRNSAINRGEMRCVFGDAQGTRVDACHALRGDRHVVAGEALLYLVSGQVRVRDAEGSEQLEQCALVRATGMQVEILEDALLLYVQQQGNDVQVERQARAAPQ